MLLLVVLIFKQHGQQVLWLGNVLQRGACDKLEQWGERVRMIDDQRMLQDWLYLQSADHFYYMKTRGGDAGNFSPYETPYDAFNNYMNVLSDFLLRVEARYPSAVCRCSSSAT